MAAIDAVIEHGEASLAHLVTSRVIGCEDSVLVRRTQGLDPSLALVVSSETAHVGRFRSRSARDATSVCGANSD
jgi:hypothetical protein